MRQLEWPQLTSDRVAFRTMAPTRDQKDVVTMISGTSDKDK